MCFRMLNQHRNDIVSRGPFFINHGDRDTNNLIILLLFLILILKHYYTLKIRSSWIEIYSLVTESSIIWQLLSIKENICPERPRKSHALQDGKKYFFLYTTRKMRSTAFQPCITLGGLHWDEMGQKHDFLKKNALKTAFLGDTILDRLTSEGVGSPKKIKNATFLMLSFNDGP